MDSNLLIIFGIIVMSVLGLVGVAAIMCPTISDILKYKNRKLEELERRIEKLEKK